jgi:hypothetical protein
MPGIACCLIYHVAPCQILHVSEPRTGLSGLCRGRVASSPTAGRQILKAVPMPGKPKLRTTERLSPVPCPTPFVAKNGSKMRACISGVIPEPVSATANRT